MAEDNLEEYELNYELINKLSENFEKVINESLEGVEDGRVELLTLLFSLTAQLSVDLGLDKKSCVNMVSSCYDESERDLEDEEMSEEEINELKTEPNKEDDNKYKWN